MRRALLWLSLIFIIYQVFHVVFYVCPNSNELSGVTKFTCNYLEPVATPIAAKWSEVDNNYQISATIGTYTEPVKSRVRDLDDKLHILATSSKYALKVSDACSPYVHKTTKVLLDFLEEFLRVTSSKFDQWWLVLCGHFNHVFLGTISWSKYHLANLSLKTAEYLDSPLERARGYAEKFKETDFFKYIEHVFARMLEKSQSMQEFLHERRSFLSKELDSYRSKVFDSKPVLEVENIAEVVSDLLEDDEEESGSDEPITYYHTFTVTETRVDEPVTESEAPIDEPVTESETVTLSENSVAFPTEHALTTDTAEFKLKEELEFWENKVSRVLRISYDSLKTEMEPIVKEILEDITPKVSEKLKAVQVENYKKYKELNTMISNINKDVEYMQTTNKTVSEPEVSRELMRERIKAAHEDPETALKEVEKLLNEVNTEILSKYFAVIQETIDVLESFAENTIQEFSNRLNSLLEYLESEADDMSDELNWNSWKKFHKIKEDIFNLRDVIYNDANDYRSKLSKSKVTPEGLGEWIDYLKNINFHIGFLMKDNVEYLRLVRAKANVAFQLREGLERQFALRIEKEKEEKEAEEARKAEQAENPVIEHPVLEPVDEPAIEPATEPVIEESTISEKSETAESENPSDFSSEPDFGYDDYDQYDDSGDSEPEA